MSLFLIGTIIVMAQMPNVVYIGADSKVISIGPNITDVLPQQKIHTFNDVVFVSAGLFKDLHGEIDVQKTAEDAISTSINLEQIADRFTVAVEPELSAALRGIRAENPSYFIDKLKQPLAILFAAARDGNPKTISIVFDVIDQSAVDLTFRVTRLQCPGECPKPTAELSLGEHAAADQFLDTHPTIFQTRGPVAAIEDMIAYQASATPDFVALPAIIVSIDQGGFRFLE